MKEGHLMLQQESSGQPVAFEEKLGDLNTEWQTVIQVWDCSLSPNSIVVWRSSEILRENVQLVKN